MPVSRALYATDLSIYRQVPIGVVVPRSVEDVIETMAACHRCGVPILGRGGGTSLAGQTCNVAVVIDFSKYLNRILEIDPQATCCPRFARPRRRRWSSLTASVAAHRSSMRPIVARCTWLRCCNWPCTRASGGRRTLIPNTNWPSRNRGPPSRKAVAAGLVATAALAGAGIAWWMTRTELPENRRM